MLHYAVNLALLAALGFVSSADPCVPSNTTKPRTPSTVSVLDLENCLNNLTRLIITVDLKGAGISIFTSPWGPLSLRYYEAGIAPHSSVSIVPDCMISTGIENAAWLEMQYLDDLEWAAEQWGDREIATLDFVPQDPHWDHTYVRCGHTKSIEEVQACIAERDHETGLSVSGDLT